MFQRKSITTALLIVGVLTILGSWISQNYFQSKWNAEQEYLGKVQLLVEIRQGSAEFWMNEMNVQISAKDKNDKMLSSAIYNFIVDAATTYAWESARVASSERQLQIQIEKNIVLEKAKSLSDANELDKLYLLAKSVLDSKVHYQSSMDERYFKNMDQAKEKAANWELVFVFLYCFGSALLGFRWLLVNFYGWPTIDSENA